MQKRIGIILVVLLCGLMVFGPTVVSAQKITANVASTFPPDSPQDKGLNKFKQLVAERSNGRIEVLIHPSNAMGDERSTFEMLSAGSVEYGAVGTNDISTFFPKYFICEVPYVFSSQDDFWKFWNGPGKELSAIIEKQRAVRTEGVIFRGARYLTANRPVNSVADVKGLKMRLPSVKSWFKVWESFGALPSTIAFGEVYMALKTGVVEGQENPPETILNYKFYEAQKYLIATEHVYSAARILSSAKWWNTLKKEDQELLAKAMQEAVAFANGITKDGDTQFVKKLQENGMTLINVDKTAFKRGAQPIIDQMAKDDWDPAFYEKVKTALK
jgi:tripartite ATP-independent transporter DctP family solute receptor